MRLTILAVPNMVYVQTLSRNDTDQLSVPGILLVILILVSGKVVGNRAFPMMLRQSGHMRASSSCSPRLQHSLCHPAHSLHLAYTVSNLNSSARATPTAHALAVQVGTPRRVALDILAEPHDRKKVVAAVASARKAT